MKLFELDIGAARSALAVLQGRSADSGSPIISYETAMQIFKNLHLPLGGPKSDKQSIMTALKNAIDPTSDVIKSIDPPSPQFPNGSLTLNTPTDQATAEPAQGAPTVDQMASQAAKKAISPKI